MTPTRLLIGQILIVFAIVIAGVWFATQWAAAELGYQAGLGAPWFVALGVPVYYPWRLFEWWYAYDAYAPELFNWVGGIAASSGLVGCAVAILGSLWRARQNRLVTTYGSSRWATAREVEGAGLFRTSGVFLGRLGDRYLRHDGPEHVMAFAPTRSGKGVGLVIPTLLSWTGAAVIHDIKGENWQLTAGWRARFSHCLLFNPTDLRSARYNPLLEVRKGRGRGPRRPEHRRYPGRSGRRARTAQPLGEDQPFPAGRRHPACPLCRGGEDAGARRHLPLRSAAEFCAYAAADDGDQPSRHAGTSEGSSGGRLRRARGPEQIRE